uniref:Pectinesterase catalytic domain-containing protein n=1 Tax=Chenopodium quinoa TaxID=63459 RepID=A0A803MVI1_CHEQI
MEELIVICIRFCSAAVIGDRFLARDLTIENTASPEMYQAVAIRVTSNYAFFRCNSPPTRTLSTLTSSVSFTENASSKVPLISSLGMQQPSFTTARF